MAPPRATLAARDAIRLSTIQAPLEVWCVRTTRVRLSFVHDRLNFSLFLFRFVLIVLFSLMKFSIATLVVVLVALTHDSANAFVSPRPSSLGGYGTTSAAVRQPFLSAPVQQTTTTSSTQLNSAVSNLVDGKQLTTFFLETLISSGVPALFTIAVIAFAANAFRPKKEERQQQFGGNNNPVTELYNDLYGDPAAKQKSPFSFLSGGRQQTLAQNTGVPAQQYIKIENRNSRLDNYQYSMNAATQSKAAAAAEARSKNFDKALVKGIGSTARTLTAFQKSKLLEAERDFLKRGSQVQSQIAALETQLTETAIDSELKAIGMSPTEMDPEVSNDTADENVTNVVIADKEAMFQLGPSKRSKLVKEVTALQESLLQLELSFIQNVIGILGPDRANGVKAALVGDVATRGAGGFLSQLQNRPLTVLLNSDGEERRKSVFVTQFPGDPTASQVSDLREEVTAIVRNSKPGDEALVVLQTGGGTVTGYGLAAAQLQRFKEHGMKLTVCVEQVAASGGYMMCCVGDRIVASPFAVLGSIGVISDIPNVYQRLKDEGM